MGIKELQPFIHVRNFEIMNSKFKWPKKGQVIDANSGLLSLLSLAFKCRAVIIIILTELNEYEPEGALLSIDVIGEKSSTLRRID